MTTWRAFAGVVCLVLVPAVLVAAESPDPNTHWFSLINATQRDPTEMSVVILPPSVASEDGLLGNPAWIGPEALARHPFVQATLEATDYWAWALRQFGPAYLQGVSWNARILGVDATADDLRDAEIVINTVAAMDPVPWILHAGVGAPVLPRPLEQEGAMDFCLVSNQLVGTSGETALTHVRNLIIHEFGHCIGAGHTGTSLGQPHCNAEGTCYESHPTDVMSDVFAGPRQCLSNLNVQGIAEGYAWLAMGTEWQPHDHETYMHRSAYAELCMDDSARRF